MPLILALVLAMTPSGDASADAAQATGLGADAQPAPNLAPPVPIPPNRVQQVILPLSRPLTSDGNGTPPAPQNAELDWVTEDDYPRSALNEDRYGVTGLRIEVSRNGAVTACDIEVSSGHNDLDTAACRAISERARFNPARDPRGRAVAGLYFKNVRWTLPEMPVFRIYPREGYFAGDGQIIQLHYNSARQLDECRILTSDHIQLPSSENEGVCSAPRFQNFLQDIGYNRIMPQGGIWIELHNVIYLYARDPETR